MIRRAGRMCSRTAAALCSGGFLSRLSSILHRNKPRRSLAPACGRGFFRNIRHARSFSTVSDRTSGRHAVSIRMYRARAEECQVRAETVHDPEAKRIYEHLADQWRLLAEQAEREGW